MFVAGLAVHGVVGGALLVVVAAVLVALSAAAWQQVRSQGRPARLVVIAALLALAAAKFAGAI